MSSQREVVAAVDIGGTRSKAALVDASYAVLARSVTATPPDVATDIGRVVASLVSDLLAVAARDGCAVRLVGCGVVVPGLVDERSGTGVLSVNLGWRNLAVRDAVAAAVGLPTAVGHDVRAGLLAEGRLGAARDARHVVFIPVGTGIAGALKLDGIIVVADGWAGELGHLVIDDAGPPCNCGQRGCLEVLASAAAVQRRYAEATGVSVPAAEVAARVAAGDSDATAVWRRAVAALGAAIVSTVTLTGVELVVVGGGLAESGETLLGPLRAEVARRLTFQRRPRIEPAALGAFAGSLGAACLAWDAL